MVQAVAPCMQRGSQNGVVKVSYMGPVSSDGQWTNTSMSAGLHLVTQGASDGASYSCWWSYAGCVRWENSEFLSVFVGLDSGFHGSITRRLGFSRWTDKECRTERQKAPVDAHCIFPLFGQAVAVSRNSGLRRKCVE